MDTVQENPTVGIWGQGRAGGVAPSSSSENPRARPVSHCPADHTMKAQGKWRSDRGGLGRSG